MYHRASRTLILVDLIEDFTDATPNIGGALKFWFKYVLRMWGNPQLAGRRRERVPALQEALRWRCAAWAR